MQPNARIAAAIELLDTILSGEPAERALTTWARAHRFAGSGDRVAIRDHVFDALRQKRSYAWYGGRLSGRGLMIGAQLAAGVDLDLVFTGEGHAAPALTALEREAVGISSEPPDAVRLDCPDWLLPNLRAAYPERADAILQRLRSRAPVFLRVNFGKTTRVAVQEMLAEEGIETRAHPLSATALEVTAHARRVRSSRVYQQGYVELQDAASQAVVDACGPLSAGAHVLDYCAGGGGKALAFAATGAVVTAHDAHPERMSDLPARAKRAGVSIETVRKVKGQFDLVLCDAPCSGSGAWRRQPEGKWALNVSRLAELTLLQDKILDAAQHHVRPDGALAYATCSLLPDENGARASAFLARNRTWREVFRRQWTPLDGADGFFLAVFQKS